MQPTTRPSSRAVSRAGLARIRGLQQSEMQPPSNNKQKSEMPDGWYFNEGKEQEFWEELEQLPENRQVSTRDDEEKKARCFNDLATASSRVMSMLSRFDEIDQDTLMDLMKLVENENDVDELDPNSIIDGARNTVSITIEELEQISESQTQLVESIRAWFMSQDRSTRVDDEDDEIPNVDQVFRELDKILQDYTERTEKASFLHTDVTDAWTKRLVHIKKIVAAKDEEIKKLKDAIEAAQAQRNKKSNTKKQLEAKDAAIKDKEKLVNNQLRMIEEQRATIEKLKGSLQNSELERAAGTISKTAPVTPDINAAKSYEAASSALDYEIKLNTLNDKLSALLEELEKSKKELIEQKEANVSLKRTLDDKNRAMSELDLSLQKYIKLASIEKTKPQRPPTISKPDFPEDHYEEMMRFQAQINQLKADHSQQMIQQAETLKERFNREKEEIFKAMETPENQDLIRKLFEETQESNKKAEEAYAAQLELNDTKWTTKLAVLTRQYENRIKGLNEEHQAEVVDLEASIEYEVKKATLDVEERFGKELVEITREKEEQITKLEEKNMNLEDQLFSYMKQAESLRQEMIKQNPASPVLTEGVQMDFHLEDDEEVHADHTVESLVQRINDIKQELAEQYNWAMSAKKKFYERTLSNTRFEVQRDVRDTILKLQADLENPDVKDDPVKIHDALATSMIKLNDIAENTENISNTQSSEALISFTEAEERTNKLTDKILRISGKNKELVDEVTKLRNQMDPIHKQIVRMQSKIKLLESTQTGDNLELIRKFEEMEREFQDKLAFKDQLIREMNDRGYESPDKILTEYSVTIISIMPADPEYYEYDEEEMPTPGMFPPLAELPSTEASILSSQSSKLGLEQPSINEASDTADAPSSASSTRPQDSPPASLHIPSHRPVLHIDTSFGLPENPSLSSTLNPPRSSLPGIIQPIFSDDSDPISEPLESAGAHRSRRIKEAHSSNDFDHKHRKSQGSSRGSISARPRKQSRSFADADTQTEPVIILDQKEEEKKKKEEENVITLIDTLSISHGDFFTIHGDKIDFHIDQAIPSLLKSTKDIKIFIPPKRAKLFISPLVMQYRVDNIQEPIETEIKVVNIGSARIRKGFVMNYISGVSIEPVPRPPPPPIVITPDEEMAERIADMQSRLKEMVSLKTLSGERAHCVFMFSSMKSALIKRRDAEIVELKKELNTVKGELKKKTNECEELKNAEPKVVYQPTVIEFKEKVKDYGPIPRQVSEQRYMIKENSIPIIPKKMLSSPVLDLNQDQEETLPGKESGHKSDHGSARESSIISEKNSSRDPSARSIRSSRTTYKKRQPIDFVLPPEDDIPDDKLLDDPFTVAIQAVAANMRFIAQLKDNTSNIGTSLESDYQSFEAYMQATSFSDESCIAFIDNVRDVKHSIDAAMTQFDNYSNMELKLLNLVRQSKRKASSVTAQLNELKAKIENEKLDEQKNILYSEEILKFDRRAVLERIKGSIQVINQLGIEFTREQADKFSSMNERLSKYLGMGEPIQKDVDDLLEETKEFITSIQPPEERAKELMTSMSMADLKKAKKVIKKLKEKNHNYELDLAHQKELYQNLLDQKEAIKERLIEERTSNNQTLSLYQAQIETLRFLFNELNRDKAADPKSPTDLTAAIKVQVLNLQAMLDTTIAEAKVAKAHAFDLEDVISQKEAEVSRLRYELDTTIKKLDQSETKAQKARTNSMFHEADMSKIKQEYESSKDLYKTQTTEIERLNADLKKARTKISSHEQEIIKLRHKVERLEEEKEDNEIGKALQKYIKPPRTKNIETQTLKIIKVGLKKKTNKPLEAPPEKEQSAPSKDPQKESQNDSKIEIVEPPKEEAPIEETKPEKNKTPKVEFVEDAVIVEEEEEEPETAEETEQRILFDELRHTPTGESSDKFEFSINNSTDSLLQRREELEGVGDLDLIKNQAKKTMEMIGDDHVIVVHAPLEYKHKRSLKDLIVYKDKKKVVKPRPKTPATLKPQTGDSSNLAIGNVSGRSIKSTNEKIRPSSRGTKSFVDKQQLLATMNQELPKINIENVETPAPENGHERKPILRPSTDNQRPKTATSNPSTVINTVGDGSESIRITSVRFEMPEQSSASNIKPLVIPINGTASSSSLSTVQRNLRDDHALQDLYRLMKKLKRKINDLTEECEEKDAHILKLKERNADLLTELNRARVDTIRAKDSAKKASIRKDDIEARLSAVMTELSIREDTISQLRKEIWQLRSLSAPVQANLAKLTRAQRQKRLAARDAVRAQEAMRQAKQSMNSANGPAKDHLEKMLENTRQRALRFEAKKRMWENKERQQTIATLEALSLISHNEKIQITLPYKSTFLPKILKNRKISETFGPQFEVSYLEPSKYDVDLEIEPIGK